MTSRREIIEAGSASEYATGRSMIEEYAQSLAIDLCFEKLDSELNQLPVIYGPPTGCLLLARLDEDLIGCGGLRRISDKVCEMKRLYVRPVGRGLGVGRDIAVGLIREASALGYTRMVLDSLVDMSSAQNLYRSLGFTETAPYYDNPRPGFVYMALDLS
jgi:ribosomal protein S18 acetylase RimI-like enzyme